MVRAIVAVGALSAMLVVAALTVMDTGADAQETPTETAPAATAAVERRDLASTEEFEGTLGYDDQRELAAQTTGTVTRQATVGRVIANGEQLARIDEEPVILLRGRLAAYRDLTYGVEGRDVKQLDEALVDLGYLDEDDADREYDWATADAVADLQDDLAMYEDGELQRSEYVFAATNLRICSHPVDTGATVGQGQPLLTVSSVRRSIEVELDPGDRDLISTDQPVEVELPTGGTTTGTVAEIGTTISSTADGDDVLNVTIALDDPKPVRRLDHAPVTVVVSTPVAEQVLAVPVEAVVGTAGGGYAVDRVRDGRTTRVTVDLGAWGDGYVEVDGDLREGDEVVVPE
jgi:peptidoglycan hydrolase-like protein with peptidoglycan-binding domain